MCDLSTAQYQDTASAHTRMSFFDMVRGFSVISMMLFHACYDLRFVYGYDLWWFKPPLQDIWRASISWTFLFIAGCMCSFSRNGALRAMRYLAVAAAVWVVTTIAAFDTPISFGIIFCMGASTLVDHLLSRCGWPPYGYVTALLCLAAFLVLQGVPHGFVGVGGIRAPLPSWLYATPYLSWLGFPGPGFASGDYYPLLPYLLMYLTGASVGRKWHATHYPSLIAKPYRAPVLTWVGQHALTLYVVHQPVIIALIEATRLVSGAGA